MYIHTNILPRLPCKLYIYCTYLCICCTIYTLANTFSLFFLLRTLPFIKPVYLQSLNPSPSFNMHINRSPPCSACTPPPPSLYALSHPLDNNWHCLAKVSLPYKRNKLVGQRGHRQFSPEQGRHRWSSPEQRGHRWPTPERWWHRRPSLPVFPWTARILAGFSWTTGNCKSLTEQQGHCQSSPDQQAFNLTYRGVLSSPEQGRNAQSILKQRNTTSPPLNTENTLAFPLLEIRDSSSSHVNRALTISPLPNSRATVCPHLNSEDTASPVLRSWDTVTPPPPPMDRLNTVSSFFREQQDLGSPELSSYGWGRDIPTHLVNSIRWV
jgi:hypothetical protein